MTSIDGPGPTAATATQSPATRFVQSQRPRPLRPDTREVAAVFVGGAVGTAARAALADSWPQPPTSWQWPTFVVNVVAAVLLGYVVTRLQERLPLSSYRRPLLGTGLCGGLSTFSTMQVEIVRMIDTGAYLLALSYAAVSIAAGYLALHLASITVRRVWISR